MFIGKRILIGCLGLFMVALATTALVPALGEAAMVAPGERDMKLLLKTDLFADREKGYQECWSAVKTVAADMGVGIKEAEKPFEEGVRKVVYFDTAKMDLAKRDYILRQRVKVEGGELANKCDLTLKYRTSGVETVPDDAVETAKAYKPSISIQEDYVGFYGGTIGKVSGEMAISHSLKKVPLPDRHTLGEFAAYFPTLGKLGVDLSEQMYPINGLAIKEYKISPGYLDFGGIQGEVAISVWYDYYSGKPITAEISWECAKAPADAAAKTEALLNALQERMAGKLLPGQTKTKFILGYNK